MKLVAFFVVVATLTIFNTKQAKIRETAWGFTKLACNTSGISAIKPMCKLKSLSRDLQSISAGLELIKEVPGFSAKVSWYRKTVTNWRHLFISPDIDMCFYLKIGKMVPVYDDFMDDMKAMFPNLPTSCPVKPGLYYALNYTGHFENKTKRENTSVYQPLPNGVYKVHLKLFNENDPLIYEAEWVYFLKKRLGEEDF